MIALFLGLSAANLLLLSGVFGLGLLTVGGGHGPTDWYPYHLALGIAAGLMALSAHMTVFTYFMATAKWLGAATDKGNLDPARFVAPAAVRKGRAFVAAMAAVAAVMAAMFSGAGGDPTHGPLWPVELHLGLAAAALLINVLAMLAELQLIRQQGRTIDEALAILNGPHAHGRSPGGSPAAQPTPANQGGMVR